LHHGYPQVNGGIAAQKINQDAIRLRRLDDKA
jgi:hypothetical protein